MWKNITFTLEPGEHLEFILINSGRWWTWGFAAGFEVSISGRIRVSTECRRRDCCGGQANVAPAELLLAIAGTSTNA
jgi:hypothetical protein